MRKGHVLPGALLASTTAWFTHRLLMPTLHIMPPPILPKLARVPPELILVGLPCGLLTGGMGLAFIRGRRALDALPYPPLVRGLVLGAIVGLIGLGLPDTLTCARGRRAPPPPPFASSSQEELPHTSRLIALFLAILSRPCGRNHRWGEDQLDIVANHREPLNVDASTLLSVAKVSLLASATQIAAEWPRD